MIEGSGVEVDDKPRERRWATDGGLDGLTVAYIERDLGGHVAAVMLVIDDYLTVQFDPKLLTGSSGYLMRFWAKRHYQNGWDLAILPTSAVATMLSG